VVLLQYSIMSACFNLNYQLSDISDDDRNLTNVPVEENCFSASVTDAEISKHVRLCMPRGTVKGNCWAFAV